MAVRSKTIQTIDHVKKSSSQGIGGRGRRIKIAMYTNCLLYKSDAADDQL